MNIEYDKKADAKYIRFKKGKVAKTIEKKPWLLFDYNEIGEVLGMEILNYSKHPVNFSIRNKGFTKYDIPLETLGVGEGK